MKKALALLLAFSLLLGGCKLIPGKAHTANRPAEPLETIELPATEETEPPTEPPTVPPRVHRNPLTGEVIDVPILTRPVAVSINNLVKALPHAGVGQADLYFETFVNGSIIRGLAMFADPTKVEKIGSVRSTRFMFTDLCLRYNAIMAHAGGSGMVLDDARNRGNDNFNIDTAGETDYSFRDPARKGKYSSEHTLFAKGTGLLSRAQDLGIRVSASKNADYGLSFVEDGTPADGEDASKITITILYKGGTKKDTVMKYLPDEERYQYCQYGKDLTDDVTGEPETFRNVIVVEGPISVNQWNYQRLDFAAGGEGFYACGGKIIPITWKAEEDQAPFSFFTEDGSPLQLGVGNTYIAITQVDSKIVWE